MNRIKMSRTSPFSAAVGFVGVVVIFVIVYPIGDTLIEIAGNGGFGEAATAVLQRSELPAVLGNTALAVGSSTLFATVIALLFAWITERTNARMGWLAEVLPVVSMLVPSIAGSIGWVLLASPKAGFINVALLKLNADLGIHLPILNVFTWPGLVFVYTLYLVPQVYLPVAAALSHLDPSLEEASRISGRPPWWGLIAITMPVIRPAVLSGILLALVYGLALFSVPLIIGTQARIDILTVEIVRLLTFEFPPRIDEAVVLSCAIVAVLAAVWAVNARIVRRGNFATIGGKMAGARPIRLSRTSRVLARVVMLAYLGVACVLPLIGLFIVSLQGFWSGRFTGDLDFENYQRVFAVGTDTFEALRNSVLLGLLCASTGMAVGVLVAWRAARGDVFGRLLDGITKLPSTLSHVVIAVALLAALAGPPFGLAGTLLLLITAYLVLYLAQATISAQSAYAMVGRELSEASFVSGAGQGATLWHIAVPLMTRGLAAGWVFLCVLVVGDITASAILAGSDSPVVGFAILSLFQNGTYPVLAALGTVITLVSSLVVLSALAIRRRA